VMASDEVRNGRPDRSTTGNPKLLNAVCPMLF
jgi:hypothetical protein